MQEIAVMAVGASVGTTALAVLFLAFATLRRRQSDPDGRTVPSETVVLLRNGRVFDHTDDVVHLFNRSDINGMTWFELRDSLLSGFPDLPEDAPTVPDAWTCEFVEGATLRAIPSGTTLRLTLQAPMSKPAQTYRAAQIEQSFDRLFTICGNTPYPVWQTSRDDEVTWYNDAYEKLCEEIGQDPNDCLPFALPVPPSRSTQMNRLSLSDDTDKAHWFEVISTPTGEGWVHFATSIDSLVNAEMAQRNFVQTLTKTFAHLPIGLAVFDKNRQLVLFNPSMVDLTHLPVDFLSSKPNLLSFFDHMRENRTMPEPKNYANWRDKLYDVVTAAREDRYAETWNLPSGLTYKITGRPHPDGAVAFLLEDISAEISLTRRFRSELELTQSVLDCFGDSVAVFSRLGVLTFSNAAYRERWKCESDCTFAEVTIVDAVSIWRTACKPSPIWSELREFVLTLRERTAWESELTTHDGERLVCIVEPVAAGATMVRFASRSASEGVGTLRYVPAAYADPQMQQIEDDQRKQPGRSHG
ncbi:PAS domain-containing protein [Sagittula marina]|uniref:PAS domain-containing protein n=1 Tax=Sagittula marina TaxID=943940 RepID=A0A7W6DIS1_9RHOB|nr:PAS-domain containing protein [Sagittula marina]MBB3983798.1 PAS domain-containing protein [Sagittula marina]